jgi:hypothetical protein
MKNYLASIARRASGLLIVLLGSLLASSLVAQTKIQANIDERLVFALQVDPASLVGLVPKQWELSAVGAGPSKQANLILSFVDRRYAADAGGKTQVDMIERSVLVGILAKELASGRTATFIIKALTSNPSLVPGPYLTSAHANVLRSQASDYGAAGAGKSATRTEHWSASMDGRVIVSLQARFTEALGARTQADLRPRAPGNPDFFRIYQVDQTTDLFLSKVENLDRSEQLQLKVDIAELREALSKPYQIVSATYIPWYQRQVFLP